MIGLMIINTHRVCTNHCCVHPQCPPTLIQPHPGNTASFVSQLVYCLPATCHQVLLVHHQQYGSESVQLERAVAESFLAAAKARGYVVVGVYDVHDVCI